MNKYRVGLDVKRKFSADLPSTQKVWIITLKSIRHNFDNEPCIACRWSFQEFRLYPEVSKHVFADSCQMLNYHQAHYEHYHLESFTYTKFQITQYSIYSFFRNAKFSFKLGNLGYM